MSTSLVATGRGTAQSSAMKTPWTKPLGMHAETESSIENGGKAHSDRFKAYPTRLDEVGTSSTTSHTFFSCRRPEQEWHGLILVCDYTATHRTITRAMAITSATCLNKSRFSICSRKAEVGRSLGASGTRLASCRVPWERWWSSQRRGSAICESPNAV